MNRPVRSGAIFLGGAVGATLGLAILVFIQDRFTPDTEASWGLKVSRIRTGPKIGVMVAGGLLGAVGVGMLAIPKGPRRLTS